MVVPLQDIPRIISQLSIATVVIVSSFIVLNNQIHIKEMGSSEESQAPATVVDASQVFSSQELMQLAGSYGDTEAKPQGLLISGRHGYTHVIIDLAASRIGDTYGNCIVMAHGLGTSARAYQHLAARMTAIGYSVVRYDYFGHGYSKFKGTDMWREYSPDMLVDQLEDVLDFCQTTSHSLKMAAFVGHSTGGIVAVHASARWAAQQSSARTMPRIILLSPALWADKPLVAQIADKIPRTLTGLIKNISPLKVLVTDAYLDAAKLSFAIDPQTKKYVHEAKEEQQRLFNYRVFGKLKSVPSHPFIHSSVLGLNCHTLRADLLPKHRNKLVEILQDTREHSTPHVLFVWGDLDVTVPYKKNLHQVQKWVQEYPKKFQLKVVERMGHELLFEDSDLMADVTQTFLEETKG